jgi:hypothetical protein
LFDSHRICAFFVLFASNFLFSFRFSSGLLLLRRFFPRISWSGSFLFLFDTGNPNSEIY